MWLRADFGALRAVFLVQIDLAGHDIAQGMLPVFNDRSSGSSQDVSIRAVS